MRLIWRFPGLAVDSIVAVARQKRQPPGRYITLGAHQAQSNRLVIQRLFPVVTQIHQAITVTVAQKAEHCLVHVISLPLLFLNRHFPVFRDGAISGPGGEPESTTLVYLALASVKKSVNAE